jgi:hypothetical protein
MAPIPQMSNSALGAFSAAPSSIGTGDGGLIPNYYSPSYRNPADYRAAYWNDYHRYNGYVSGGGGSNGTVTIKAEDIVTTKKENKKMSKTRIVRVFIVDNDEKLKPEDRLVYSSPDELVTDLIDKELFFDINIKEKLSKHNMKRKTTKWTKEINGKPESGTSLPPVRVRDLKMHVAVLAEF